MHECMYICKHICMCVCMYYKYVFLHVYMYFKNCILHHVGMHGGRECMYTAVCMHLYVCIHVCVYAHMYAPVRTSLFIVRTHFFRVFCRCSSFLPSLSLDQTSFFTAPPPPPLLLLAPTIVRNLSGELKGDPRAHDRGARHQPPLQVRAAAAVMREGSLTDVCLLLRLR